MSVTSAIAIYFIIWWVVLFAVLPIGVRTQEEEGEVVPGTVSSAPHKPLLIRKAIITTIVAGIVFAAFYWLRFYSGLTLDDFPI